MSAQTSNVRKIRGRRTSDILRNVLLSNPEAQSFTIGEILEAIGAENPEASLVLFSVPSVLPVPHAPVFCGLTAGAVGGHFVTGSRKLVLPKAIEGKRVPRRSLAVAIHAVLPILEFAEKRVRPRLAWMSHPISRRIIGLLVFILAATIAFPVIGFDPLHATSIFVMSLGLAEQDGVAIILGAGVGLLSLASLMAIKLHGQVKGWLRILVRKLGFHALAGYCEKRGWNRLASFLRFEWKELLLLWDPERSVREKAERASAPTAASAATGERRTVKTRRDAHKASVPSVPRAQSAKRDTSSNLNRSAKT